MIASVGGVFRMKNKKRVLVILADGFEEIEAVTPIDVLRRAELEVVVAGLNKTTVTGAHGLSFVCDVELAAAGSSFDAVVLPGGMPGAANLAASPVVAALVKKIYADKKIVGAICAAPAVVLNPLGILDGKKATCYPGFESRFGTQVQVMTDRVTRDGTIITSRGPGTAFEFSLALVSELVGKSVAERLSEGMVFRGVRA
jgi:4-methyl-5(b-hydroxyethyl)-thiazole monophosphate biosynthesis